jgi:hypothetical protein
VLDAGTIGEFLLWRTTKLEEVSAEPNLLYMGLVAAFSYYLFYRVFFTGFFVLAEPNQRKTASSQKTNFVKTLRKTVSERLRLLSTEVIGVFLLFLPTYLYFFQRLIAPFVLAGTATLGDGMLGRAFIIRGLLLAGKQLGRLHRAFLSGLLLEGVLDVALLARRFHLLPPHIEVLQTFRNVLFQGSLLESRPMGFVRLPKTVIFAAVGRLSFFKRAILGCIFFIVPNLQSSDPRFNFFKLRFLV